MQSKTERAALIAKAVVEPNMLAAKWIAGCDIEGRIKWLQVNRGGWSARVMFRELSELTELIDVNAAAKTDREWNDLELKIDGCLKLKMRWRGRDVEPIIYLPGRWEQRFGIDNGNDIDMLVPPTYR